MAVHVFSRQLPMRKPVDVLVAGGGMAGYSAAVAAARAGARTLLVEPCGDLGGTATVCGVGSFCGETRGQGEVFDDVIAGLEKLDAVQDYRPYAEREFRKFDHELLKFVLAEGTQAAGVELLLHASVADVEFADGVAGPVVLHTVGGLAAVEAKVVIDCTGNGAVAQAAGLETMKGRPRDGLQLPMSMMFFLRDVGRDAAIPLPDTCERWDDDTVPMLSIWNEGDGQSGIKMKVIGHDATDPDDMTAAELKARRMMMSAIDWLNRGKLPTSKLSDIAARIGVREGWRIVGDYVLTEADLRAGRRFDDAVATGCFYLDAHSPTDRDNIYQTDDLHVPPYQIPFGTIRAAGAGNVLMAGRCFSAEQMALSSARVMTTASMLGQAAGAAAAMCADANIATSAVDAGKLQKHLTDRGAAI